MMVGETYATVDELAARLGRTFTDAEKAQAKAILEDASALMRAKVPDLDERIASGELDRDIVKAVCIQLAARMLTNASTGGVGVRSETHPEYGYSLTGATAAGLTLTPFELDLLLGGGYTRAFSVMPRSEITDEQVRAYRPPYLGRRIA